MALLSGVWTGGLQFIRGGYQSPEVSLPFLFSCYKALLYMRNKNKLPYFFENNIYIYMARRQMLLHSFCSVRRAKEHNDSRLRSKEISGVAKYCRTSEIFCRITISLTPLHVSFLVIFHLDRIDEGASTI